MDAPSPPSEELLGLVARFVRLSQAMHALLRKLEIAVEGRYAAEWDDPHVQVLILALRSIRQGDLLLALVGESLHQFVQKRYRPLEEVHTLASLLIRLTAVVAPLVGKLEPAVEGAAPAEVVDNPRVQLLAEALQVARQWNEWLAELAQQIRQLEAGYGES